ncbi:MAG TPA: T9SS type A sorting domain-containing protein [Flavobacteriales bacterium]|nr:T9SS type A sorting domain-containing protein [Flavobacteriales bacterium]
MKRIIYTLMLTSLTVYSQAGTFTSNVATGTFNVASSWTAAGDADGIPDIDDDVTIQAGHQINLGSGSNACRNLIVAGRIHSTNPSYSLSIRGNYTNTGIESGSGVFGFANTSGCTISGAGTYGINIKWQFVQNTTLAANVTAIKNVACTINYGKTITNLGSLTLNSGGSMVGLGSGSTWLNGATGTLVLNTSNFMTTGTRNFSTAGNTLVTRYTNTLFTTVGNTFGSLSVTLGALTLANTITIQNNLTVSATLTAGANDINVSGNVTLTGGTLTQASTNELNLIGTSTQTFAAGTNTISNITINNSAAGTAVDLTSGTLSISDVLTITDGELNIGGTGSLVLLSDATKTAIIGQCGSGASISGSVTCQRFIDARSAGYSDMASSVAGATFADWDNELIILYTYNPPNDYPSCWGYDEAAFDYVPITSSATAITPGIGYEVYLDSDGSYTTFNATTINTIGTPNIGDLDMSGTITASNDGWNLVGNPYHANLDWDALQASSSGIGTDFMYFDETIDDFNTASTGSGELIAPNQGFWIENTGGASFMFTEAIKSTSTSSTFRSKSSGMFGVRLKSADGHKFTSGTQFRFSTQPELEAKGDLIFKKLPHPKAPQLYTTNTKSGKNLRIKLLDSKMETLIVPMVFAVENDGNYTLSPENIDLALAEGYNSIILVDQQTGSRTELTENDYYFYVAKGTYKNRFSLVLTRTQVETDAHALNNNEVDIIGTGKDFYVDFKFDVPTKATVSIINMLGEEILPAQTLVAESQKVNFSLTNDFSGIYLVNVTYNNKTETRKLFR